MVGRTRPAALPALRKRLAALPGHRIECGSYREGCYAWQCECGQQAPPLPVATAAIHRFDHLEIHMGRATNPAKFSGQPLQFAGKSIFELLWEEMDRVYARLMSGEVEKGDKHYARGVAYSLAILTDPYKVDIDAVRDLAHERWENAEEAPATA